jgi:hypothetical protein
MTTSTSSVRSVLSVAVAGLVSLAALAMTATPAGAVTPTVPKAPVALPADIEPMAPYQPQKICDAKDKPGIKAVATLLTTTYTGTAIVSTSRPCVKGEVSEHYDGRAIDWGVDFRKAKTRIAGRAFLKWLWATDANGNKYAMMRRLGIMYVIWHHQIWGTWNHRWSHYSCHGVTACHIDHMHLSFDWSGALKKTSFWTGVAAQPMKAPTRKWLRAHGL